MRKPVVVVLVVVLLAAGSIYLGAQLTAVRVLRRQAAELAGERDLWKSEASQLRSEAKELRSEVGQLGSELADLKTAMRNYPILHNVILENLKERTGRDDPVRWMIKDLMPRESLIPIKGVLGGTMRFEGGRIWILDDRFALAEVCDGHITGWVALEFRFGANGELNWKTVAYWS